MRMAGPDLVLFVVGAVLFGGASYAIVAEGGVGSTSALGVFEVGFAAQVNETYEESVASVRSATVEFDVGSLHATTVRVTVACDDPAPGPAAFQVQVTVEGPNGLTGDGSGACAGGVPVEIVVATLPSDTTVQARTEAEAHEAVHDGLGENYTAAQGTWTVTVSGARGQAPAVPVGDPAGTITLEVEEYAATYTPVQR